DRAAYLYCLRQPVLVRGVSSSGGRSSAPGLHLRDFTLRRLDPAGLDRRAGAGFARRLHAGGAETLHPIEVALMLAVENLKAYFGKKEGLGGISLTVPERQATAIIGPSGCGKSTLVRCLNRMHEETPGAHADGRVLLRGSDIYANGIDPVDVRRR